MPDNERIPLPTTGEILRDEFMEPMGLSAYRVARDTHVPVSRIQGIIRGERRITVDTALRLGRLFGVSDGYFLAIQDDIDVRNAKRRLVDELDDIRPIVREAERL